ncbi:MAG: carbohydrate ABC transporter permease [Acholeplasmataceae bacterium]
MKKIKVFFQNLTAKIKGLFQMVKKALTPIFVKIGAFWMKRIDPFLSKVGYALMHNPIIYLKAKDIRIFGIHFKITRARRDAYYGYMFILLWLIGFFIFTLYPMGYAFYLSLHEAYYNLQEGITTTYVGFDNYLNIFRSQTLVPLFVNYLIRMFLSVPLIIVFSIMIAVLINVPMKGKAVFRTIFFLPVIIATGPVIGELTNQNATTLPALEESSILNFITSNLGSWIADPLVLLLNSLLLVLWYAGIPILIFLAGLQKIDKSIYEAADIDGASPWDRFWKITLPGISSLIGVSIIYVVVTMSLFVESGGILELTRSHMLVGAPDSQFWFGYGYAAAIAWTYFVLMVVVMGLFVLLSRGKKEARS